jgi:hypothetical protein
MRKGHSVIVLAVLLGLLALVPSGAQTQEAPTWQHSAKFLCGRFTEEGQNGDSGPVVAGMYATAINVHNPNFSTVVGQSGVAPNVSRSFSPFFSPTFRKKALVLFGSETPSEPEQLQRPGPWVRPPDLPYDWGFEIDCNDIRQVLLGDVNLSTTGNQPDPRADDRFIKGYVVIEARSFLPIDVVAAYTGHTFNPGTAGTPETREGFSEDIETVQPKRIR